MQKKPRITRKTFQDAARKGQDKLRKELGEEAYIARLKKIGKKGGNKKASKSK